MLSFCLALSRFLRLPLTLASFSAVLALAGCADDPTDASRLAPTEPARVTAGSPGILITPDTVRFGGVMLGQQANAIAVKVTNNGTTDLSFFDIQIQNGTAPDEFFSAWVGGPTCTYGGSWALAPGQSCYVGVNYKPMQSFPSDGVLGFTTNAGFRAVWLTGQPLPPAPIAVVSPQDILFDDRLIGTTSAEQAIEIVNKGEADLVLTGYQLAGIDPSDFTIVSSYAGTPCQLNQPIAPWSKCDLYVAFAPKSVGGKSATLAIATNAGPTAVTLAGVGYLDADVSVSLTATAQQGKTVAYTATIRNAGPGVASSINLNDVLPSGATFVGLSAPSDVSCSRPAVGSGGTVSCFVNSLASGDSRVVELTLKPGNGARSITNVATVGSLSVDPVGSNNTASVTTQLAGRK